jgi:TraM recognition site of TraD and TraG
VRRANTPQVPLLAGNGAGIWVVLLIGWGLVAAVWLAWLAARIAAALARRRMPPFGERWVISLAGWRTSQAWPGTPTVSVWGEPGMAALWGASTKKVIGAGIDDPRHARDLATLVGQHDVPVISVSYGDGRASRCRCAARRSSTRPTSAPWLRARPCSWRPEPGPR